jgi:hypothetical protein
MVAPRTASSGDNNVPPLVEATFRRQHVQGAAMQLLVHRHPAINLCSNLLIL